MMMIMMMMMSENKTRPEITQDFHITRYSQEFHHTNSKIKSLNNQSEHSISSCTRTDLSISMKRQPC